MDEVKMFPLDFEEFVEANGESPELVGAARAAWEGRKPIASVYHARLLKLFRLEAIGTDPEKCLFGLEGP